MNSAHNPFYNNPIESICIVCNQKLENDKMFPVTLVLTISENAQPTALDILKFLSNFEELNIDSESLHTCPSCFNAIENTATFIYQCDKSAANLLAYLNNFHEDEEQQEDKSDIDSVKNEQHLEVINIKDDVDEISEDPTGAFKEIDQNLAQDYNEVVIFTPTKESLASNIDDDDPLSDCMTEAAQEYLAERKEHQKITYHERQPTETAETAECPVCHKILRKSNLNRHLPTHDKTRHYSYKCKICDKVLKTKDVLRYHIYSIHGKGNTKSQKCSTCGRGFKKSSDLILHMRRHSDERPFECKKCGSAFYSSYELRKHLTVHTNEDESEPFPVMVHETIKPYGCAFCAKKFLRYESLKKHQMSRVRLCPKLPRHLVKALKVNIHDKYQHLLDEEPGSSTNTEAEDPLVIPQIVEILQLNEDMTTTI